MSESGNRKVASKEDRVLFGRLLDGSDLYLVKSKSDPDLYVAERPMPRVPTPSVVWSQDAKVTRRSTLLERVGYWLSPETHPDYKG